MKLNITRAEMWSVPIEDRSGGAAEKLAPLAKAGSNFEFVFARRTPEQPGRGLLFVYPVKGARLIKAAKDAGFAKSDNIEVLRIEETDAPGVTARIAGSLAAAGINLRALSASTVGSKFVSYLAMDTAADAAKATTVLKNLT